MLGMDAVSNGSSARGAMSSLSRAKPPVVPRQAFVRDPNVVYELALSYARESQFRASRVLFERLLKTHPSQCKAWVSYAMMEKKAAEAPQERFARCREVLQRGLSLNPTSACLVQAWGLMELQKCNWLASLLLLERAVKIDPTLQPVLNWTQVNTARKTVGSRRQRAICTTDNLVVDSNSTIAVSSSTVAEAAADLIANTRDSIKSMCNGSG